MEVGAVKQAFNNEIILLKKKLNQAKIQIIHKLTRKAKTFTEKKAPEKLKEKFTRKAEAFVKEVLLIKTIKPKDLARFIITHKGELQSYLNKPNVDQDKACARLLLHKSLQDKYKIIRDRFSSVPIDDLLMSREERRKLKKEAKEKQKNKKKGKSDNKVVNSEGNWDVSDVELPIVKQNASKTELSDNDEEHLDEEKISEEHSDEEKSSGEHSDEEKSSEEHSDEEKSSEENNKISETKSSDDEFNGSETGGSDGECNIEEEGKSQSESANNSEDDDDVNSAYDIPQKRARISTVLKPNPPSIKVDSKITNQKLEKKSKDKNKHDKNKNLNEKLLSRKFKKELNDEPLHETKIVDPFFITSTGENYMSVVEPRGPDEVKEVHREGNRKLRRAIMFGHVPKIKPRKNNFVSNNKFGRNNNGFNQNDNHRKFNNSDVSNNKRNFSDRRNNTDRNVQEKPEKLHPSWEAKKKQSGILPFQGKKTVFDEG